MNRITVSEMEVADAAHHMGYELLRGQDGYLLLRRYGPTSEAIKAPTLDEIRIHLTH